MKLVDEKIKCTTNNPQCYGRIVFSECTCNKNVQIALKISKYIHDNCKDVPHDIGMKILKIIEEYI